MNTLGRPIPQKELETAEKPAQKILGSREIREMIDYEIYKVVSQNESYGWLLLVALVYRIATMVRGNAATGLTIALLRANYHPEFNKLMPGLKKMIGG